MTTYTQAQVDELHRQWEASEFEAKTKEVLANINRRLAESNAYKETIGKDIKDIAFRIEQIETARLTETQNKIDKHQWHQSWWVRVGILFTILFQGLNFLINAGIVN